MVAAQEISYTAAIFQSVFSSYNKLRSSPDRRGTYQLSSGSSSEETILLDTYRTAAASIFHRAHGHLMNERSGTSEIGENSMHSERYRPSSFS